MSEIPGREDSFNMRRSHATQRKAAVGRRFRIENMLMNTSRATARTVVSSLGLACAISFAAVVGAFASPASLHEKKSVTIDAPVDDVWSTVGNFPDLTWVPAVKSSTATKGNSPGSQRTLDFGGAQMTETLVSYDQADHRYTYRIDNTPTNQKIAPVTDVLATISVTAGAKGKSTLTWEATFHRLDHADNPAVGADDAAASKQISAVFAMGLEGAKKKVGTR